MRVFVAFLALVLVASTHASQPCVTTKFETEMYADACKVGGQDIVPISPNMHGKPKPDILKK
ncbi:hypothetical protein [Turneriella parva]|uniref:Uncharacterized protein n=1 Tax=Turneriella parva (strain ATCC BAA-1111 / DSM 21527 / NCTC 11395 / H) TaxID=869212 RepID=I4B4X8_TURPD|nr:hypothetical protein [Turneriella parva]AFM12335.1 hypothetical protein Turpa_1687 [Turneriella parva DSM 21527]